MNREIKTILSMTLMAMMGFNLASCGQDQGQNQSQDQSSEQSEQQEEASEGFSPKYSSYCESDELLEGKVVTLLSEGCRNAGV